MGKGSRSVAAPDPAATAAAQTATNKETAYWNAVLNNTNQVTPYGNITYTRTSGDATGNNPPQFTSRIDLNPESQKLLDTQMRSDNALANLGEQQIGRIGQAVSSPYSYSGLPSVYGADDMAGFQKNAEDAIYSRLDPQFSKDEESLRTRLINQGIGQGSEAYQREMNQFNQNKNDARMQAVLQGANYGTQMLNNSMGVRNQAIQEYNAQRNAPLNEYTALTSGQQVQNPQFSSQGNAGMNPVDYAGLVNQQYQAQQSNANARNASSNSMMGGLFGLGGSILGGGTGAGSILGSLFSDRHLKENIIPMGQENGHNIYEFSYKGHPTRFIGVMAHEVEKTHPEAVTEIAGYKAVNYKKIGVEMREVSHG